METEQHSPEQPMDQRKTKAEFLKYHDKQMKTQHTKTYGIHQKQFIGIKANIKQGVNTAAVRNLTAVAWVTAEVWVQSPAQQTA